ncbi:hypothetical protein ACFYQ5_30400 [Streptomyces sp. NPDC005794]|uniref:hypothetical protein n=1 Tax=Streptomyces sp. NPDC005794 TaxID=3364733 RepID=UPI0036856F97
MRAKAAVASGAVLLAGLGVATTAAPGAGGRGGLHAGDLNTFSDGRFKAGVGSDTWVC